jgi:hypothetical protein
MKQSNGVMNTNEENEVLDEELSTQWRIKYSVKNEVLSEELSTRWRMKY